MILKISDEYIGQRLDKFLLSHYPDKTRSHIKHWIEDGVIKVNDKIVKAGYEIRSTDIIDMGEVVEKVLSSEPQDIPIEV